MTREPVQSKAIRSVGYDAATLVLEIEFTGGRVYAYDNVSPETHEWLMRARNKGAFITRLLGSYSVRDVTPAPPEVDLMAALSASLVTKP